MTPAQFLSLVAMAAVWGASFLFMRIAVPHLGPVLLIATRLLAAAVFLWLLARLLRRPWTITRHWRQAWVLGAINSALPFVLFAFGARTLTAGQLSILNSMAPIFAAILLAFWMRQPLKAGELAGLVLGVAGVAVLMGGGGDLDRPGAALAAGAALLATFCYACAGLYMKARAAADDPYETAHGTLWAAAILMLPFAALAPAPVVSEAGDWAAAVCLGVLCTAAPLPPYFKLLREVGALKALSVTFLIPVFGVFWGTLLLGEPLGAATFVGGAVILAGTAFATGVLPRRA